MSSRRTLFPRRLCLASTLALSLAASAAPTAVLVDTSRSVPPARFEEAKGALADLLPALLEDGPVALYAFNDSPERVADFTTDAAVLRAGIAGLKQGGNFTLLYDCLFGAVKALEARKEPGVVLLVTDGRDENSAVTLEDAASRAAAAHVGVVTAGLGAPVDQRTLRRIATLTGGRYAGDLPSAAGAGLRGAFRETSAALVPFPPSPAPPKPAAPAPAVPVAPPAAPPSHLTGMLWLLLLALVASAALLAAIILRRTRRPDERTCEACGHLLNIWDTECPACLAKKLSITKPGTAPETPAAPPLPDIDPALMQKAPPSESLDHTMVLDEVPVLTLKRSGQPPRMFQLPAGQVVSVGRDKVNTISVADLTLSGQHFRIIPKGGSYYLADLHSTNGTLLNGERVTLRELKPGSVIQAGQCEFAFRMEQKKLN